MPPALATSVKSAAHALDAGDAATAPFWPAVSVDATLVDQDKAPREIAGLPLWPSNRPEQILYLWQEMKQALCQANEGWESHHQARIFLR
jgi:hypothetical protein